MSYPNSFVFQSSLVVEIPPYRNQRLTSPVHVNFYVCNGKRKRSQCQHFTYLPPNGNHHISIYLIIPTFFFISCDIWGHVVPSAFVM